MYARASTVTGPLVGPLAALIFLTLGNTAPLAAQTCTISPSSNWKNAIDFPGEPFRVQGSSSANPDWIKFTIVLCDPDPVYYQDSNLYTFHYEFAVNELDPFFGYTPTQYNNATLYAQGQEAILGAVIMPASGGFPPPPPINEYGIQFVRQDPYTPQEIVDLFHQVKATVNAGPGVEAFYFPTFEQLDTALQNSAFLASQGVIVSSPARWAEGNACYAQGWALGELKFFPGEDIENAYLTGALTAADVLLTDGVPAEVPFVAGIMSLTPSTPNSHVAILAQTFNIPFVHLALPADAARAQSLVGRRVALRAYDDFGFCDTRLIDVHDELSPETIAQILQLKTPPPLNITPMAVLGAYSGNAATMVLNDIQYFGGKASNFGFLRRAIPASSPVAGAFSFDVWNQFLDQALAGGNTLRQEIATTLGGYTYPPNIAQLAADLDDLRDLIKDDEETLFDAVLENAILTILQDPQYGFDPLKKIRFRSSTNVEDSDQFTGAGLYDSNSGCLADDLDADDVGPSHCDPTEPNEKGVFRAIRRVFASFYNDNAFLERLRYGVDESTVGMAVLFHHSFPDELELANGVSTYDRSPFFSQVLHVTQLGAESVSNPSGGAIPEEVQVDLFSFGPFATVLRYSSLMPIGQTVMEFDQEYLDLADLMELVAEDYAVAIGEDNFLLDFEFKKMAPGGGALPPGGLVVKQVRKIPQPSTAPTIVPYLVNEPVAYCTYQGEYGDVFANHRLKTRLTVESRNLWLTPENLACSVYTDAVMDYTDGCWIRQFAGILPGFPFPSFAYEPLSGRTIDGWHFPLLSNPRAYTLFTTGVGELVSEAESPILTLRDFGETGFFRYRELQVDVDYAEAVPSIDYMTPITTTHDSIRIAPCQPESAGDLLQERSIADGSGITIETAYYWPPDPGAAAGYTAPVIRWVETTIAGLTSEPIVLTGWTAQSYRPEHHNFSEHFIFEPRLEPGISQTILDELDEMGIQFIHALTGFSGDAITLYDDIGCTNMLCENDGDCGHPDFQRYCVKAAGDCDGTGTCAVIPVACPDVWDPVCGCDGVTYGNDCEAAAAGVSIAHTGPCPEVCGGILGVPCDEGTFCMLPVGQCCCDAQGVCTVIPDGCPEVWDPVCGCDGITYGNDCEAAAAGVSIAHTGPCPVVCGGILGVPCDEGSFCKLPAGQCCCDVQGICTVMPDGCPDVWDPVCGCDGVTYGNDCEADAAGVSVDYPGACQVRGACCLPDGTCIRVIERECDAQCGAFRGPRTRCPPALTPDVAPHSLSDSDLAAVSIRPPRACPIVVPIAGACCQPDGACTIQTACACEQDGGVYQGDFSDCTATTCLSPGRCCIEGKCLSDVTAAQCHDACGSWSDVLSCAEAACPLFVAGACCVNGTCFDGVSSAYCACQCGTYLGHFSGCGDTDSDGVEPQGCE